MEIESLKIHSSTCKIAIIAEYFRAIVHKSALFLFYAKSELYRQIISLIRAVQTVKKHVVYNFTVCIGYPKKIL